MNVAAQLGKVGERLHQILAETDGMRGNEADAPDSFHFMHGFQQLDEAALAACRFHLPAVPVDDLAQQRDFLHAGVRQHLHLIHHVPDGAAAFCAAGVGNNAVGALHFAPLHDGDIRRGAHAGIQVIPDSVLGILLFRHIAHMRTGKGGLQLIHAAFLARAQNAVHMFKYAVVFLGADHEVQARQFLEQLLFFTLGHAAHHAVHYMRTVPLLLGQKPHFSQSLLFRLFPDGTGVEQDDVRLILAVRHGVALLHEHAGHLFGVPFVHLAAVGFDIKLGHGKNQVFFFRVTTHSRCLVWGNRSKGWTAVTEYPALSNSARSRIWVAGLQET